MLNALGMGHDMKSEICEASHVKDVLNHLSTSNHAINFSVVPSYATTLPRLQELPARPRTKQ